MPLVSILGQMVTFFEHYKHKDDTDLKKIKIHNPSVFFVLFICAVSHRALIKGEMIIYTSHISILQVSLITTWKKQRESVAS